MLRKIRLLIVDDSGFMRIAIRKMVEADPEIEVVGEARNGVAAVNMNRELKPDVITMDVEMPDMDGLAAARAIMAERPAPIIMVSSLTQKGAQVTVEALSAGAVDFISKSSSFVQLDIVQIDRELKEKIHFWGRRPVIAMGGASRARAPVPEGDRAAGVIRSVSRPSRMDLVVVAVSTGGPRMFPVMLKALGRIEAPMVVAQHMPEVYTASFATHLRADTGLDVREGQEGMELTPGSVTIVPGGRDGMIGHGIGGKKVLSLRLDRNAPIHPNGDILFESAARVTDRPVAVILTGMGNDGSAGARKFADKGLPVLVQTPDSCVVGGMPQAAMDAGVVSHVLSLEDIARKLHDWDRGKAGLASNGQ